MSHSSPHMIPAQPWQEPTSAYPPRFWWLKRGAILFVVALLALGSLRWWWGKIADDRLAAMIAEAHAPGEPILPEDFNPAPIPDSQNAAMTLRLAADSIVRDATYDAFDSLWRGELMTPAEATQASHIVSINQKSLRLCRHARLQPDVDWMIPIKRPVFRVLLSHLNSQRALANLESLAAFHDHATGNDAETINRIRDILRQASAVNQRPSCETTYLVRVAIEDLALNLAELITPELHISGTGGSAAIITPATREQVSELIGDLLNQNEPRDAAIQSWQGERMFNLDIATYVASTGNSSQVYTTIAPPPFLATRHTGPLFTLAGMRSAQIASDAAAATRNPDWPAAAACLPTSKSDDRSELEDVSQLFGELEHRYDEAVQVYFKLLTDRRAAAIALSLRMYRLDHSGRLPATLQELVPQYLPYVPLDPMAAGGRPMQYRPKQKPPVIYSVGTDGVDNGGTSLPTSVGPGSWHWFSADAVYPLEALLPETQPSAETQDHQ